MPKKRSLLAKIFDFKMWFHDFVKLTGGLPVLLFFRVKKIYMNKTKGLYRGNYIISSNHISYADPTIISTAFWMRRVGFLATKNIFENKILNFMFTRYGCVPVDKENPSVASFKKVANIIERGHTMCVFPEGSIVKEENIGTFKSGIVMMAVMADADILPVYIPKRKNWFKRQVVVIGEKINYKDYISGPFPTIDEVDRITKLLLEKELELKNRYLETIKKS